MIAVESHVLFLVVTFWRDASSCSLGTSLIWAFTDSIYQAGAIYWHSHVVKPFLHVRGCCPSGHGFHIPNYCAIQHTAICSPKNLNSEVHVQRCDKSKPSNLALDCIWESM